MENKNFGNINLEDRLIVSVDVSSKNEIDSICKKINNRVSTLKIGLEVIYNLGLSIIDTIKSYGYRVMLDTKLMDIPNTVNKALIGILHRDVFAVTVHLLGGRDMLRSSEELLKKEASSKNLSRPYIFGVSILTSLGNKDIEDLGFRYKQATLVKRLVEIGVSSGVDGIICSPNEAGGIRKEFGDSIYIATPGIRLKEDSRGDQKRVNTPDYSIKEGADFLIVGRPILQSKNIESKIDLFLKRIEGAL